MNGTFLYMHMEIVIQSSFVILSVQSIIAHLYYHTEYEKEKFKHMF